MPARSRGILNFYICAILYFDGSAGGGTGIRACLRGMFSQEIGGSNPLLRTKCNFFRMDCSARANARAPQDTVCFCFRCEIL